MGMIHRKLDFTRFQHPGQTCPKMVSSWSEFIDFRHPGQQYLKMDTKRFGFHAKQGENLAVRRVRRVITANNKSELLKENRFGSKGQWSSTHSAAPLEHVDVLWADKQCWAGPLCSWAAHQGWTLVLLGHPPGLDPRAPGPHTRAGPSCSWAAH